MSCIESNQLTDNDDIDQMVYKNEQMKQKLGIVISSVESHLAMAGLDISDIFSQDVSQRQSLDRSPSINMSRA